MFPFQSLPDAVGTDADRLDQVWSMMTFTSLVPVALALAGNCCSPGGTLVSEGKAILSLHCLSSFSSYLPDHDHGNRYPSNVRS